MNIRTWKLTGALTLAMMLLSTLAVQAGSTLTYPVTATQSSPALTFYLNDTYGTLEVDGPTNSSATFTFSGNPQMVWLPAFGAFMAGGFNSGTADSTVIGLYSVAFGYQSVASGPYSAAFGGGSIATGSGSTALGGSEADGTISTAMGGSLAIGVASTAMGESDAVGNASTAMGEGSANGNSSTAMGEGTANGTFSTAAGNATTAGAYESFVIGTYNVNKTETNTSVTTNSWVTTDPLFEIGNGTGTGSSAKDAVVVYKDGTATVQGPLTVNQVGGDIPMYVP